MFYSQWLLSNKGSLGSVWVAAHYFKRLKKKQVKQTDIVSSVDTILNDEADVVTYRILGFLLLGVVRIYSKKVEFLFHDCLDVLDKLQNFMADQIVDKNITSLHRSYHSISLPERFELDAFDLDILDDQDVSRIDVGSNDDITLADASRRGIYCQNDKYYGQDDVSLCEAFSSAYTPVRDVCSPSFMEIDLVASSPYDINQLNPSREKHVGTSFASGKCLEPKMFIDVEKEGGLDMSSNDAHQTFGEQIKHHNIEINYDQPARLEKSIANKSMEPIALGTEKETGFDVQLYEGHTTGEQIRCPDLEPNCQEPVRMQKSIDNESVEPMMLNGAEREAGFDMPGDERHQTDGEQVKHADVETNCQEPARMETLIDNQAGEPAMLGITERQPGFHMPSSERHQPEREQVKHADVEINCQEPAMVEESIGNKQSMEKLREFGVSSVDHLRPIVLGEVEKSPSAMLSKEKHKMIGEQRKHPNTRINLEEPEEMRLSRNQIQEKCSLSISVNITPDSKITAGSGPGQLGMSSPEFIAVRTPATKEHARVLKKRKCLFDDKVVFSNKVIKDWINSSSDLVCKRRKAPATTFHAWKVQKIYTLPKSFFEPLIPCKGVNFRLLASRSNSVTGVSIETAETPLDPVIVAEMSVNPAETPVNPVIVGSPATEMSVKTVEAPINPTFVESLVTQVSREETPIAPATPVTHSVSLRLHEVRGASKPIMLGPASSLDSIDKQQTLNQDRESDIGLMDEEVNSSTGDNPEKCEWSTRTRRVAIYLHRSVSKLTKKDGTGVISLSQVLKQKSRTESARLFYEILALKTRDYIDVRQEDPYGDILVQETPKLKQTMDAYGDRSRS